MSKWITNYCIRNLLTYLKKKTHFLAQTIDGCNPKTNFLSNFVEKISHYYNYKWRIHLFLVLHKLLSKVETRIKNYKESSFLHPELENNFFTFKGYLIFGSDRFFQKDNKTPQHIETNMTSKIERESNSTYDGLKLYPLHKNDTAKIGNWSISLCGYQWLLHLLHIIQLQVILSTLLYNW